MKRLFFLLLLLSSLQLNAQTFQWAKNVGGFSTGLTVDNSGNVLITGAFIDSADYDPGPGVTNLISNGGEDVFIAKLNSSGNLLWAKSFGGGNYDRSGGISTDAYGNVFVTGHFHDTVDFDPRIGIYNLVSNGNMDCFVLKLDSNGNFAWAKQFGSGANDVGEAISVDAWGNVYTTGSFINMVDFDPNVGVFNLTTLGVGDIFLSKLDNNGNFIWAKKMGGFNSELAVGMTVDYAGNIYTTGFFRDTMIFNLNVTPYDLISNGGRDAFISKYDSAGNFVWAKNIGGPGGETGFDLAVDSFQNVYSTGTFTNTCDFDPGSSQFDLISQGSYDVYVSKLNINGDFVWAKRMGASLSDEGLSISLDKHGNVFAAGHFMDTVDFDPGLAVHNLMGHGSWDMYITKLDTAGDFVWAKQLGGFFTSVYPTAFEIDIFDNLYFTGSFGNTVDFDPGPGVHNLVGTGANVYILKLEDCMGSYRYDTIQGCDSTIINGVTYYSTGNYVQLLNNQFGCDSFINLNLTIKHSTTNTIIQTGCYSLVINGQTYNSSGTYTQTVTNANACDSILTLNLTINHPTINSISQSGCDSLVINGQTYTSSGTYTQMFTNSKGCDSILTLNLTINHSTTNTISQMACDSLAINGQTYFISGTYTQTLINSQNCDSILTLYLTINNSSTNTITQNACNSYTLNGQTYISSGNYTQTLTNAQGCDSILTLNVAINSTTPTATASGLVLNASPSGATYQWLNCNPYTTIPGATNQTYTATANGNYAVIITQNGCSDTSNCVTVIGVGINDIELTGISVYPNPSTGSFTISSTNHLENASLKVLNTLGEIVYQKDKMNGSNFEINLESQAAGFYTLEISEGEKKSRLKLLKK